MGVISGSISVAVPNAVLKTVSKPVFRAISVPGTVLKAILEAGFGAGTVLSAVFWSSLVEETVCSANFGQETSSALLSKLLYYKSCFFIVFARLKMSNVSLFCTDKY